MTHPIEAVITSVPSIVQVTAAIGGAGQGLPATPSSSINLALGSFGGPVQYKVGAGAWITLDRNEGVHLPVDLSRTVVLVRKNTPTTASIPLQLIVNAVAGTAPSGGVALPPAGPLALLSGTRALRKAIDNVKTGIAAAGPIVIIGDSTDRGPDGIQAQSWPTQMAAILNQQGLPASADSFIGASIATTGAAVTAADPRVTLGAGWTVYVAAGSRGAGGFSFQFPANTAPAPLAFTPANPFNQADIYYFTSATASFGQFAVDRAGAAPTAGSPINPAVAQSIGKTTVTWAGNAAAGPLNIQAISGASGAFRVLGVVTRDTANPKLEIINMGWAASSSKDWMPIPANGAWSPEQVVLKAAPVAIIFGHEINDFNPGVTAGGNTSPIDLAAFKANAAYYSTLVAGATFIVARKAQSDPSAFASVATQEAYFAQLQALALAGGFPVVDFQAVCGDYPTAQADGLNFDARHYNVRGFQRGARAMSRLLLSL